MPDEDQWLDVSAMLGPSCPKWPGSPGVTTNRMRDVSHGDHVTETHLSMDVHCGTHVDAPAHFLEDGATVDELPLDAFLGVTLVADASGLNRIRAENIETLVPAGTKRVLFRTDNSNHALMRTPEFREDFVALAACGAAALAARTEILAVGNDYLSVQLYGGDDETHRALFRAGIAAIEGLDLTNVPPGLYDMVAIPLRLGGAEAAPLRAALRPVST